MFIDLGDDWSVAVPEQHRRFDRRIWLLLLALVPVLAVGGSARVEQVFREVTSVPASGAQVFATGPDRVDVLESSGTDTSTLASYPVDGGPRRWSGRVPGPVNELLLQETAGVLLALDVPASAADEPAASVAALDTASGRLLWSRTGAHLVDVQPQRRRAVLYTGAAPATEVFAIDLRTGQQSWVLHVGHPHAAWAVVGGQQAIQAGVRMGTGVAQPGGTDPQPARPGRLIALVDDTLTLIDEESGAVLATRAAGIPSDDARRDERPPRLYLIGRQGILGYEDHNQTVYSAYDLTGLARRWHTTMPTEISVLTACGGTLCAGTGLLLTCYPVRCSAIDSFLFGLDPGTAATRWISARWSRTGATLDGPASVLAFNREPPGLTASGAVIDPITGRTLLELGRWAPVAAAPGTPTTLLTLPSDSYHSWLAVLGARPARLIPIGRLPVAGEACQSTTTTLTCPTLDGRLTVWRYGFP